MLWILCVTYFFHNQREILGRNYTLHAEYQLLVVWYCESPIRRFLVCYGDEIIYLM
jgi:hypothetical protein